MIMVVFRCRFEVGKNDRPLGGASEAITRATGPGYQTGQTLEKLHATIYPPSEGSRDKRAVNSVFYESASVSQCASCTRPALVGFGETPAMPRDVKRTIHGDAEPNVTKMPDFACSSGLSSCSHNCVLRFATMVHPIPRKEHL
jgi:hypothetical protein